VLRPLDIQVHCIDSRTGDIDSVLPCPRPSFVGKFGRKIPAPSHVKSAEPDHEALLLEQLQQKPALPTCSELGLEA